MYWCLPEHLLHSLPTRPLACTANCIPCSHPPCSPPRPRPPSPRQPRAPALARRAAARSLRRRPRPPRCALAWGAPEIMLKGHHALCLAGRHHSMPGCHHLQQGTGRRTADQGGDPLLGSCTAPQPTVSKLAHLCLACAPSLPRAVCQRQEGGRWRRQPEGGQRGQEGQGGGARGQEDRRHQEGGARQEGPRQEGPQGALAAVPGVRVAGL